MDDFDIKFDYESDIPLYRQLYDYLLRLIHEGKFKENDKLPSRRALCGRLKINKNTVESAYQKLAAEGYIMAEPRSGFYVRSRVRDFNNEKKEEISDYIYNFSINAVDVFKIPYKTWSMLYKDIIYEKPDLFNHGENFGERILLNAIERYVHRYRGINCMSNQIVVGAGIEYLVFLLILVMDCNFVYGLENPFMEKIYSPLSLCGRKIYLVDTRENGFSIEELEKSGVNVIFVMPSVQYPIGYCMSIEKRKRLLEWANAKEKRYIVEFHYGSEFVYKNHINSIKSFDKNEKVIYIGDFVNTIGPSIKTAFIILPEHILKNWKERLSTYYAPVNLFEQWVLAEFIQEGYYIKHIKQMKSIYIKKRDFLISELRECSFKNSITLFDNPNGTHFIAKFDTSLSEREIETAARREGVKIIPLSRYFFRKTGMYNDKYFIFGFGGLEKFEIKEAVKLLERAWGAL